MAVTLLGDRTANALNHAEVGPRLERELAPIHLRLAVGQTAANWDQVVKAENVTTRTAQVRTTLVLSLL